MEDDKTPKDTPRIQDTPRTLDKPRTPQDSHRIPPRIPQKDPPVAVITRQNPPRMYGEYSVGCKTIQQNKQEVGREVEDDKTRKDTPRIPQGYWLAELYATSGRILGVPQGYLGGGPGGTRGDTPGYPRRGTLGCTPGTPRVTQGKPQWVPLAAPQ